jgi:MFS family permease
MATLHDNFRLIFWLALIPGLISVLVLLVAVREPPHEAPALQAPLKFGDLNTLGAGYWIVVAIGAVLTLARFSEAFLILRAQSVGLSLALAPIVLVIMNIVYAISAYPLGALSDQIERKLMLALGFATLTQGLLAALVADEAPAHLRATSFGVFHFVSGIALLLASIIAGALWEIAGPYATFIAGATFTAIGLLGTAMASRR